MIGAPCLLAAALVWSSVAPLSARASGVRLRYRAAPCGAGLALPCGPRDRDLGGSASLFLHPEPPSVEIVPHAPVDDASDFIQRTREIAIRRREERERRAEERAKQRAPSPAPAPLPSPAPLPILRPVPQVKKKLRPPPPRPMPRPHPPPPAKPPRLPVARKAPPKPRPPEPTPKTHEDTSVASWSPGTALCGTVRAVPGSVLLITTCDLTDEIGTGDGIRVGTFESTVTTPRDARTITLNEPFQGVGGQHLRAYKIDLVGTHLDGFAPLPGCVTVTRGSHALHTSVDLRRRLGANDVVRVRNKDFVIMAFPRTADTLALTAPFPYRSSSYSFADNPNNSCEKAYKRIRPWDGGITPLTCCVRTKELSNVVETTHDLSRELLPGQSVRIRTETFRVVGAVTPVGFSVEPVSRLPSSGGLRAFVQHGENCSRLEGHVSVTKGSSLVTTSSDLRAVLSIGDSVRIGEEQFEVVAPTDPMSFVISREWDAATIEGATVSRCLFPRTAMDATTDAFLRGKTTGSDYYGTIGTAPLSTFLRVTHASTSAVADTDPSPDGVGAGDIVSLCGDAGYRIESIVGGGAGSVFKLSRPWTGTSGLCRMWRVPFLPRQQALAQLALKKSKCLSLYCLAKLEEEERNIAFDIDRALSRLPSSSWTVLNGKDSMSELGKEVEKEKEIAIAPAPSDMAKPGPGSGSPISDHDSILKAAGAGPGLPVPGPEADGDQNSPTVASGTRSGRLATPTDLAAGSEFDAMKSDIVQLAGYQGGGDPGQRGSNPSADAIVPTQNLPDKIGLGKHGFVPVQASGVGQSPPMDVGEGMANGSGSQSSSESFAGWIRGAKEGEPESAEGGEESVIDAADLLRDAVSEADV